MVLRIDTDFFFLILSNSKIPKKYPELFALADASNMKRC